MYYRHISENAFFCGAVAAVAVAAVAVIITIIIIADCEWCVLRASVAVAVSFTMRY